MGLFGKKKEPPKPENRIGDKQLKEYLGDAALAQLINGSLITTDDFPGITVEFGYLYVFEGHGVEALFKLTAAGKVYYFAAQGNKLLILDSEKFTEGQFIATIDSMKDMYEK